MNKTLLRLLGVIGLIFCLGYFVLATEVGLTLLVDVGRCFVPGQLTVHALGGSVLSGVRFQDLHYQDQENNIAIQTFNSRWQLQMPLTRPLLVIKKVEIKNAAIKLAFNSRPREKQEWSFSKYWRLLQYFRLNQIQLTHIQVFHGQELVIYFKQLYCGQAALNNYAVLVQGIVNHQSLWGGGRLYFKEGYPFFDKVELHYGESSLSLQGKLAEQWNLQTRLTIPQLKTLLPEAKGFLSLQSNLSGTPQHPQLDVTVETHQLQVADHSFALPKIAMHANAYLNNASSLLHWRVDFDSKNKIVAHLTLPPLKAFSALSQPIQGAGVVSLLDLTAFNSWLLDRSYGLSILQGKLTGSFQIEGSLNHPILNYDFLLTGGAISLNELRMRISDLNVRASQQAGQEIKLDGRFKLGQGRGLLQGTMNLLAPYPSARLSLIGDNLVYKTDDYQITASPHLQLNLSDKTLHIEGDLRIPTASIHRKDWTSGVVLPSEIVFVDAQKSASTSLYDNLALKMKLVISNKVDIQYENLNAELKGALFITSTPGNSPIVTGELYTLKGRYRVYGRQLDIQKGRFIYAGNLLSNPGLDIRATQKIKTIDSNNLMDTSQSVGVLVRGTLNKPVVSLFSDPSGLSQGDILSYLILGRPQSEASEGASLALLSAASSMAGGEDSEGLTEKLQNKLHLNDLSIGSTAYVNPSTGLAQQSTTANVGKNFGSKISLHYSIGLFDPVSIIRIRYKLHKYFVLQSETSSLENAGDLLYQIESAD